MHSLKTKNLIIIFALILQSISPCFVTPAFSAPLFKEAGEKLQTVEKAVIINPTRENANLYVDTLLKEYKKANRAKCYEQAADYLRSALYFLQTNPKSAQYVEAKNNLDIIMSKIGAGKAPADRLEIAKNLYLEKKYFASAYEFSTLLKEEYEPDICYEFMGDIANKLNLRGSAFSFYKKAVENNPENLNAKYKFANLLLNHGYDGDAIYYFEDVIENTNSDIVINEIIKTFSDKISKNPNNENYYEILGLAYQKIGQYDKTYQLLRKSLVLNPNDIFLRYHLGNLLYQINEYSFASEIFTEILEDNPYESQIRIARAKVLAALNKTSLAIKDYQVILAMYPDSIQAQFGLYTLLKNKEPLDKIINLFYPLEPNYKLNAEGYNNLGYFANKMQKIEDAAIFFEKSLSINPKSETPYIELYKLYQLLGQNTKAVEILKSGYKIFPKNPEIIKMYSAINSSKTEEKNNVALSYVNEGEYKKAIAIYSQIEPKGADTYEAIAACYRQLGDFKNALNYYKMAIEIAPDNSELYYALGTIYLEANNQSKAKEAFINSIQINPSNIKAKQLLSFIEQKEIGASLDDAYALYEKKDYASALLRLNSAVKNFPDDPKVHYYRGLTKAALGDYKGAASDYKTTVGLDRNFIEAYYNLADALERIKKPKEALFMYEKYLGAENIDEELAKRAEERVLELGERYY